MACTTVFIIKTEIGVGRVGVWACGYVGVFLERWVCHAAASSGTLSSTTSWRERYSTLQAGVYNSIHYQQQVLFFGGVFFQGGGGGGGRSVTGALGPAYCFFRNFVVNRLVCTTVFITKIELGGGGGGGGGVQLLEHWVRLLFQGRKI